jgi:hypothetical protein
LIGEIFVQNEDLTFTAEEDDTQNNSEEDDGEYLDEYPGDI